MVGLESLHSCRVRVGRNNKSSFIFYFKYIFCMYYLYLTEGFQTINQDESHIEKLLCLHNLCTVHSHFVFIKT